MIMYASIALLGFIKIILVKQVVLPVQLVGIKRTPQVPIAKDVFLDEHHSQVQESSQWTVALLGRMTPMVIGAKIVQQVIAKVNQKRRRVSRAVPVIAKVNKNRCRVTRAVPVNSLMVTVPRNVNVVLKTRIKTRMTWGT